MQPLGGQTLISHVINTAKASSENITVVVGHKKDLLREHIAAIDPKIKITDQDEQLGTAHAVKTAAHMIQDDEKILILYGDVPLISSSTIESLISAQQECTLLSMHLSDPTGYGRIMTDDQNNALKIIEQKDAAEEEVLIHEVFTSILLINGSLLQAYMEEINTKKAAKE